MIIHDDGHTNVIACDGLFGGDYIEPKSSETKEEFDNFRDEFLTPNDPELRAILADTKLVFF